MNAMVFLTCTRADRFVPREPFLTLLVHKRLVPHRGRHGSCLASALARISHKEVAGSL
jgi:hypothetical protein